MIFALQAMPPQEMRPRSVFSAIPKQEVHQEFQAGIPKSMAAPGQAALQETEVPRRQPWPGRAPQR